MTRPVITIDPAVRFGRPHINGIGVEHIAGAHWVGDDAAHEYDLAREQVLVACWYMARYGTRRHRRRWRLWVDAWEFKLSLGEYDQMPDPPTVEGPQ